MFSSAINVLNVFFTVSWEGIKGWKQSMPACFSQILASELTGEVYAVLGDAEDDIVIAIYQPVQLREQRYI